MGCMPVTALLLLCNKPEHSLQSLSRAVSASLYPPDLGIKRFIATDVSDGPSLHLWHS